MWAAQQRFDSLDQRFHFERLGHVVVGTHVEADNFIDLFRASGQHENGDLTRPGIATKLAADFQAFDDGEHQIEQNQVGQQALSSSQTILSVVGTGDFETLFTQRVAQGVTDAAFVVD